MCVVGLERLTTLTSSMKMAGHVLRMPGLWPGLVALHRALSARAQLRIMRLRSVVQARMLAPEMGRPMYLPAVFVSSVTAADFRSSVHIADQRKKNTRIMSVCDSLCGLPSTRGGVHSAGSSSGFPPATRQCPSLVRAGRGVSTERRYNVARH